MKTEMEKFSDTLWKSAGCRFNAHLRSASNARVMLIINSAVSAHLIFYSALVFANKIKPEYADLFNAGILLGSLSVLCIGLIGAVLRMDVYSNIMHESGKLINEIKSNVSLVGRRIANPQEIDNFLRKQNARYRGICHRSSSIILS